MPQISIILPVYNVEKYIKKCIQSILMQTYTDFELLAIIDGSPDNSLQVIQSFTDTRIKIFKKVNGGLSDARNYGLGMASGKYVYFLDSDDWIEPNLLEDCVAILDSEQLDLVIFGYIHDVENNREQVLYSNEVIPEKIIMKRGDQDLKITSKMINLLGYVWNKVYLRNFLLENEISFEKGTLLVEDVLFNTQVYCRTKVLRTIDKAYYHYMDRPVPSLIKQTHKDVFISIIKKHNALNRFLNIWNINEKEKNKALADSLIKGFRYCLDNLFSINHELSLRQKFDYVKKMTEHPTTNDLIKFYHAESKKDIMYKYLIQKRYYRLICFITLLYKKYV